MEKIIAPIHATTPTKGETNTVLDGYQSQVAKQAFIGAAVTMSWQLAFVVLLPIIGGFKLDQHLKTTPLLTIVGFLLAMIGMALVLWRQLQELSPSPAKQEKTK